MRILLTTIIICFTLAFRANAEESFNLDDVTIEIVEDGDEIAHQIALPTVELEQELELERNNSNTLLVRESHNAKREREALSGDRESAESEFEMAEIEHQERFREADTENLAFELEDQFLDIVEEEASELVQMSKQDFREAAGMADEILQLAEEQALETEDEVEENNESLEEEHRDEAVLSEEIEQYEDKEREEEAMMEAESQEHSEK